MAGSNPAMAKWRNSIQTVPESYFRDSHTCAATAKTHGLTILTRNQKHFAVFRIAAGEPFQSL